MTKASHHDDAAMPRLPAGCEVYRRTPTFTGETMPAGLRHAHRTRAGVWGRICVHEGRLRYLVTASGAAFVLDPRTPGIIAPGALHEVEPLGAVRFHVEFLRVLPDAPDESALDDGA